RGGRAGAPRGRAGRAPRAGGGGGGVVLPPPPPPPPPLTRPVPSSVVGSTRAGWKLRGAQASTACITLAVRGPIAQLVRAVDSSGFGPGRHSLGGGQEKGALPL
ncbi:MAG: hypothetical protein F4Y01_13860, partial [Gammaproteobacteria bacterium]|nr:hypothetical protein [Gammaproteobacteria bacterium]